MWAILTPPFFFCAVSTFPSLLIAGEEKLWTPKAVVWNFSSPLMSPASPPHVLSFLCPAAPLSQISTLFCPLVLSTQPADTSQLTLLLAVCHLWPAVSLSLACFLEETAVFSASNLHLPFIPVPTADLSPDFCYFTTFEILSSESFVPWPLAALGLLPCLLQCSSLVLTSFFVGPLLPPAVHAGCSVLSLPSFSPYNRPLIFHEVISLLQPNLPPFLFSSPFFILVRGTPTHQAAQAISLGLFLGPFFPWLLPSGIQHVLLT